MAAWPTGETSPGRARRCACRKYCAWIAGVARRREAAHLADVHPDEVDQAPLDQRAPFERIVEQFAHRQRGRTLRANLREPVDVFRRERVFQKEQLVRLDRFGETHRVDRRQALVDVVQQFDLVAERRRARLDHLQHVAHIGARIVVAPSSAPSGRTSRAPLPP